MPGRCAVSDCEPTSWLAATRRHSSPSVPWLRLPWLASNLYLGSEQLTSGGSPDPRQPPFGAGISTDMALSGRLWERVDRPGSLCLGPGSLCLGRSAHDRIVCT